MKSIAIVLNPNNETQTEAERLATVTDDLGLKSYVAIGDNTKYDSLSTKYSDQGTLSAIVSLMEEEHVATALLVPVDLPLIDGELITQLIDSYVEEDTIVCFRQHGNPNIEPFPALYERGVLQLMMTDLAEGKITLQQLLNHTGSHIIEIPKDKRLTRQE